MRPFDLCGTSIKQYAEAMKVVDDARAERARLKDQRAIDNDINNAYEIVDKTAGCVEFPGE